MIVTPLIIDRGRRSLSLLAIVQDTTAMYLVLRIMRRLSCAQDGTILCSMMGFIDGEHSRCLLRIPPSIRPIHGDGQRPRSSTPGQSRILSLQQRGHFDIGGDVDYTDRRIAATSATIRSRLSAEGGSVKRGSS